MKKIVTLAILCAFLYIDKVQAQNNSTVFNPQDVVTFLDANAPKPVVPANDNNVYKWVATKKVNWDSKNFKPYILNGLNFRLRYPKNYNPSDTSKKYPVILFFHGKSEVGDVYDNDQQLYNGGYLHDNAIINNTYDGFLIYPQSTDAWGYSHYERINLLLKILTENAPIDPNKIVVHGLSYGGKATLDMIATYPKLFAAALPMSAIGGWTSTNILEIPMWVSQGALDKLPSPSYTKNAVDELLAKGAQVKYTLYPELGHNVWNATYNDPD